MKTLTLLAAVGLAGLSAAASAAPGGRAARCVLSSAQGPAWSGPCRFFPERGGSFAITPVRGAFPDGVGSISLVVTRPGEGEVRGLTGQGINSRWGTALRDRKDRACWVGSDFRLCVY